MFIIMFFNEYYICHMQKFTNFSIVHYFSLKYLSNDILHDHIWKCSKFNLNLTFPVSKMVPDENTLNFLL